jgi:predicted RNA-binding protein associated with RNAse of E/G family
VTPVPTLTPTTLIMVRLLKAPRPDVEYPATVLHDDGDHVAVRAPWFGDVPRDMGFAVFEPGDVWTEHFWRTRWFSVKEVHAADGTVKGWYCDVTRPATVTVDPPAGPRIEIADLDLDLWLSGDHTSVLRLDEDEFDASGLAAREPETAARAMASLDELEGTARAGGFKAARPKRSTSPGLGRPSELSAFLLEDTDHPV